MKSVMIIVWLIVLSGCASHHGSFAVNANLSPPEGFDSVSVAYSVKVGQPSR